jgi:acyl-CoA dehydrogenase
MTEDVAALAIDPPDHASHTDSVTADVVNGLLEFIDKRIIPIELEHQELLADPRLTYDADGHYAEPVASLIRKVRQEGARAGYYTMFAPRSVGGEGLGPAVSVAAWEALYYRYGPGRLLPYQAVGHWTSGVGFLLEELAPDIRAGIAAQIMNGTSVCCFGMSEPEAGSDARAMTTRARWDGSNWLITGTKQWISNATIADYAFVFAATEPDVEQEQRGGISCFLVPTNSEGFRIDSVIPMFGSIGGKETIISFSEVQVPSNHLVGQRGSGFDLAIRGVSEGRLFNVGRCVGLARWALELAIDHARSRKTFGNSIIDYQAVSFTLAECAIEIYAAKLMGADCAARLTRGENVRRELAMAKSYAVEMCTRVYDRCMQVHGAMGFTNELRLVDGWHQARSLQIADGSNEILRRTIVHELINGNVMF